MKPDDAEEFDHLLTHWMSTLVTKAGGCYAVSVACRCSEGLVGQWTRGEARPPHRSIIITSQLARDWGYFRALASSAPEGVEGGGTDALQDALAALQGARDILDFKIKGRDLRQLGRALKIAEEQLTAEGDTE